MESLVRGIKDHLIPRPVGRGEGARGAKKVRLVES